MVPRDTSTGWVLEQMILPSLDHGGYHYQTRFISGAASEAENTWSTFWPKTAAEALAGLFNIGEGGQPS